MRQIDIDTWPRREHFNLYNSFEFPHFNLCANVDLTNLLSFVREKRVSLNVAII